MDAGHAGCTALEWSSVQHNPVRQAHSACRSVVADCVPAGWWPVACCQRSSFFHGTSIVLIIIPNRLNHTHPFFSLNTNSSCPGASIHWSLRSCGGCPGDIIPPSIVNTDQLSYCTVRKVVRLLYKYTGDVRVIRQHLDSLKMYVDYMATVKYCSNCHIDTRDRTQAPNGLPWFYMNGDWMVPCHTSMSSFICLFNLASPSLSSDPHLILIFAPFF